MSRDNDINSLSELLKRAVQKNNWEYGIDKVRVKQAWNKIAGMGVERYTQAVNLQGTTLIVSLSSAALCQELSYGKTRMIELINEELGKEVVKEIILK
ncbi:DUF721 domain-containing protein [Capnocytophaga catalasegens]|uniref:BPL/LPL catalytic domain-containing protein n=1 Tax=Capnocytophaga catalasegens TaxID=1004260 RepID=A0AAV5AV75_9FLAO|nr:DUF721 domain-containing protein [Capnocytophaga catalasegens]GIZ15023.1 hypothetical protein RCZ03_10230 [Capnocytophaga catalasegens]GJM49403.1 hypothetical protein RCZ15_03780 [Capnocytophaga catalasegens]GJM52553.1 hypothetical protein RCZ16_08700 [Capnocytophaga catalasegens]